MRIEIHYCQDWNYEANAASLAEKLQDDFGVEAKLIPGHNGIFDIIVNGKVVFSKYEAERFPNYSEISSKLKQ